MVVAVRVGAALVGEAPRRARREAMLTVGLGGEAMLRVGLGGEAMLTVGLGGEAMLRVGLGGEAMLLSSLPSPRGDVQAGAAPAPGGGPWKLAPGFEPEPPAPIFGQGCFPVEDCGADGDVDLAPGVVVVPVGGAGDELVVDELAAPATPVAAVTPTPSAPTSIVAASSLEIFIVLYLLGGWWQGVA